MYLSTWQQKKEEEEEEEIEFYDLNL